MIVAFPHANFAWDEDAKKLQTELAEIMVRSVRRSMPGVEIWQLTDLETPQVKGADKAVRRPTKNWYFVEWMMEHYSEVPGEVIFLDSDVVVQKDLGKLFQRDDFDVLCCIRDKSVVVAGDRRMPLNMGVVISRCPEFWKDVHSRIQKMPDDKDRGWWGAQVAAYEIHLERKYRFYALPMDPFNYAPQTEDEDVSDKAVVHYKGRKRKAWMLRHRND